ncbi:filamentous hemagglutinin N-terminal domain-containing protein [Haemophilus influenzae]|uniref:Filamentous hemagglutinin N-terminal domain-containing protein n=7 Tax=Haemophilus influenzae TaxID=727 RepID=A0AAJ8WTP9_HAEI3|nr:filamentous hemagglutinin N-terminal domain-containing protein [Haemophilus influenzae]CAH0451500.1 filamentous hemagglutinin N-terminal domain-containing protein [Haemophilus influenzae]
MNKIYRLKFSKRLNALVAVSELTRGCDHSTEKGSEKPARMKVRHLALKPLSAMLLSLGVTSIPQSVLASGLQEMSVVHGTATMQVDGNKTTIRNSVNAIINWKQFNIGQNEMVQFLQESNNSAVFNRVTSDQISQLKGILDSNGQVFLINPNGITIGKDAIINTNGFTASTLDISNENIKARNFTLEQTKDKALAEIVNHGLITVGKDGSVNLIGGKVKNEGVISVNGGSISLLAGQKITISDIINPTITYSIAAPKNEAVNLGEIFAKGGNINVRAATIRNKGKLSADSVSKDKSGNIILSAKEGEAEISGVISAQNQQAKGGKLMITGDKVTLKTGAVIDLSGKEGGETYLGGDERGEGKNGIQLAKKTTLEKGSTINVSGKEKGGRAIVWGDIALINGNINAQGSDIAETGGFVETSGHYLSIDDNVIVKTKEWLLDPENVSIEAPSDTRSDTEIDSEFPTGLGTESSPRKNNATKTILTNATISNFLKNAKVMNITATQKLTVNSSIDLQGGNLTLHTQRGGIEINADITSSGDNDNSKLNIHSGSWVDIHKNITLGEGYLNITAGDSVAFEGDTKHKGRPVSEAVIEAQGLITSGKGKGFRFNNVTLNGTGAGLRFTNQKKSGDSWWINGIENKFDGNLNISGNVNVSIDASGGRWNTRLGKNTYWNVSILNVSPHSNFSLSIDTSGRSAGQARQANGKGLNGMIFNNDNTFNVKKGSTVNFKIKTSILTPHKDSNYASFNGNISVRGGGSVNFNLDASSNDYATSGVIIKSQNFNVSEGSTLNLQAAGSTETAFSIKNNLTLNATGGNILLRQIEGTDSRVNNGVVAEKNITFKGGNITFGSQKATTKIKGNVTIEQNTNATLRGAYYGGSKKTLDITGDVTNNGNLITEGSIININGNLTVSKGANLQAVTNYTFNVASSFNNNGISNISIARGGAKFKDINNTSSLNITTNSDATYGTAIEGNITNSKGDLNITNNGRGTEIQIGGNISQKEGNLTISSDKVNITKQITIKAGVDEDSSSSSTKSNANLTIKTKTLELTNDLNISGFNKAEITAKNDSNLTIGKASSGDAKKVTFDKVKDSKISANGHKVTLNSEVETSNGNSDATGNSNGNNAGLTISAKDVAVNNNITSHKTVNISASEGGITTKADTTINAATGSVEVTAKTGDIKGEIESASGNVNITASGNTLNVSNITGQNVTVTANSGAVTTTKGSTINATTGNANITTQTGSINGKVESSSGSVTLIATGQTLAVGNISGSTVTVTANNAKLTTTEGSTINATTGAATISTKEGDLKGEIEAKQGSVKVTAKEGNLTVLNVTAKNDVTVKAEKGTLTTTSGGTIKSEESGVNLTAKSGNINGDINATSGAVTVTANTDTLSVANITSKTATLTANSGALTTLAGSTIKGTESVTTSSQSGSIGGEISGSTVKVTASGSLTTQSGSKIEAKAGEANVTSATGTIGGTVSGNTVNVTANTGGLTVEDNAKIDATNGAATLTATSGKLTTQAGSSITSTGDQVNLSAQDGSIAGKINAANVTLNTTGTLTTVAGSDIKATSGTLVINAKDAKLDGAASGDRTVVNATNASGSGSVTAVTSSNVNITGDLSTVNGLNIISKNGKNTVVLKGAEIDVKYIQPGVASANEVIEAKRVLEKVKDLSDEERETLAKLGVSAVRFVEPNNTITVNTQNEFTTRPSSQVTISEGKACFSSGNGAAVCTNITDGGQQ